jgi:hypothetical protein
VQKRGHFQSEIQRLQAAVKEAALQAAANYESLTFQYTAQTGQKWINGANSSPLFTGFTVENFTATVNNVYAGSEAKELGVQEKDIVDAVVVQTKPPQAAPVWQALSQGLQSAERTLEKTSGEDSWSTDGVLSQEIIQQHDRRHGVAWNVDPAFTVPSPTLEESTSNASYRCGRRRVF